MRSWIFLRLIYNKVTSRSYSYFLKFVYFSFLRNWFFQPCQKLQSLVQKPQGILGVNSYMLNLWLWNWGLHLRTILPPCILMKIYILYFELYIFGRWKNVSLTNHKIFMNFFENLKLLWVFDVLVKKIHINYKIYSTTLNFLLYV
jgi:hypothetical protein